MKKPQIKITWENGEPPQGLIELDIATALESFLMALDFSGTALNLMMAGDATLRSLNARFRGKDNSTDILSWRYPEEETLPGHPETSGEPPLLGELAVSLERVAAQARENGWDEATELMRLLAHGCVHLAGYDHETEEEDRVMQKIEISLLEKIGLGNLYG